MTWRTVSHQSDWQHLPQVKATDEERPMNTSPNQQNARHAAESQERTRRQDTCDKVMRGVERANPLLILAINLLRLLEEWRRYFG